jgi:hypothetical protein
MLASRPNVSTLNLWGGFAVAINALFLIDLTLFFALFGVAYVNANKKVLYLEMIL